MVLQKRLGIIVLVRTHNHEREIARLDFRRDPDRGRLDVRWHASDPRPARRHGVARLGIGREFVAVHELLVKRPELFRPLVARLRSERRTLQPEAHHLGEARVPAAHRPEFHVGEAGLGEQFFERKRGVPVEVIRRIVQRPDKRHGEEEHPARLQHAPRFAEHDERIGTVLEHLGRHGAIHRRIG